MTKERIRKDIAARLRGLRDAMGWTVEELAVKAGVPVEDAVQFETGTAEVPVGYLVSVAHACNVDLTVLVSGGEAHLHGHTVVRKGCGLSVERRKDYDYKSLAYRFTGRRMEPFLIRVPPKERHELHFNSHPGQEFIFMLKGRLEITLGEHTEVLEEGDSLYFSSHTPHALRGLDGDEAVFIDVLA